MLRQFTSTAREAFPSSLPSRCFFAGLSQNKHAVRFRIHSTSARACQRRTESRTALPVDMMRRYRPSRIRRQIRTCVRLFADRIHSCRPSAMITAAALESPYYYWSLVAVSTLLIVASAPLPSSASVQTSMTDGAQGDQVVLGIVP